MDVYKTKKFLQFFKNCFKFKLIILLNFFLFLIKTSAGLVNDKNAMLSAPIQLRTTRYENKKIFLSDDNKSNNDFNIASLMQPFSKLFKTYAIDKSNEPSNFFKPQKRSKDLFKKEAEKWLSEILNLYTTTTTTTQKPSALIMQTFFDQLIETIEKELSKKKRNPIANGIKSYKVPTSLFSNDNSKSSETNKILHNFKKTSQTKKNSNLNYLQTGKISSSNDPNLNSIVTALSPSKENPSPLTNLLQFIGLNAKPTAEEVQIGRDKSISVLGMPIGRRDGIALSPLTGISYGNQDMFGPIAFNDRYNVKWDFLDKIQSVFLPTSTQKHLNNNKRFNYI